MEEDIIFEMQYHINLENSFKTFFFILGKLFG